MRDDNLETKWGQMHLRWEQASPLARIASIVCHEPAFASAQRLTCTLENHITNTLPNLARWYYQPLDRSRSRSDLWRISLALGIGHGSLVY